MEQRLRRMVLRRLESLGEQASCADPGQLVTLARGEIRRLTDGWRGLLTAHQPDEDGRCQQCPGWLRNRRWPCHVWQAAHHHLVGEASLAAPRRRIRPVTFGRRGSTAVPRQRPPRRGPVGPAITAVPSLPPTTVRTVVTPARTAHAVAAWSEVAHDVESTGTGVHRAPVLALPH